jgi:hypothetical protein
MRIIEILTESKTISLAMKAYASLSSAARYAIDSWEVANLQSGSLARHIEDNDDIAREVETAFKPVRDSIPGDTIMLYRGIQKIGNNDDWKNRKLESWTSDKRVAEYFAGLRYRQTAKERHLFKILSSDEIDDIVKKYERTGFVRFNNYYYLRNKENPKYYDIYDKDKQYITDGDNLRQDIEDEMSWRKEYNAEKLEKAQVFAEPIDKNKIVWITNNLNLKEFIVRAR